MFSWLRGEVKLQDKSNIKPEQLGRCLHHIQCLNQEGRSAWRTATSLTRIPDAAKEQNCASENEFTVYSYPFVVLIVSVQTNLETSLGLLLLSFHAGSIFCFPWGSITFSHFASSSSCILASCYFLFYFFL